MKNILTFIFVILCLTVTSAGVILLYEIETRQVSAFTSFGKERLGNSQTSVENESDDSSSIQLKDYSSVSTSTATTTESVSDTQDLESPKNN